MIFIIIFSFIFVAYIALRIYQNKISKSHKLQIFFSPPGAGKTTLASWYAKQALKRGEKVYSNVNIKGCLAYVKNDLGVYDISDGTLILDEAGVEFDNRKFKDFKDSQTFFFKYHRHYKLNVLVFSQSFEDMDIKIRNLAQDLFLVSKSFIPFFIVRRQIYKSISINDDKQIIDSYNFVPFGRKYVFAPSVWNMFNSYSRKELPVKEFELWK